MSRRKARMLLLSGYVAAGAFMTQFLTLCGSTATAGVSSSGILIDDNGYFLGLLYVCGQENIVTVTNGIPGQVQFTEDDLMFGCPARQIDLTDDNGGDGGGGG